MMELSKYQIRSVHESVAKILKEDFFDVRIEIADHILSLIEKESQLNPELSFTHLLSKAIESIGGKKQIREIAFNKKYELWKSFLNDHTKVGISSFRWPQILLSLVSIVGIYNLLPLLYMSIGSLLFVACMVLVGTVECIDRMGQRGWINDLGSSITSFPIYARSGFVTNLPILFALASFHFIGGIWIGYMITSVFIYFWIVFFAFRFFIFRRGVLNDLSKYRTLHEILIKG